MSETTTLNAASYTTSGKKRESVSLPSEVFDGVVNMPVMHQAVKAFLSNQRLGLASTKTRGLVAGGNQKPWKQKGTGRARVGSIRSPLWRHGGTVHGPQPRSYDYTFPRKKLLGALRSALASKFADGKLTVVNAFDVKEPNTKQFREALDGLKVEGTVLLVEEPKHENRNLELSSRNIEDLELVRGNEVHPYHLLRYDRVIFSQPAIEKLQLSLKNSISKRQRQAAEGEGKKTEKKAMRAPRRRVRHEKAAEVA